jgi:hypothetical protein
MRIMSVTKPTRGPLPAIGEMSHQQIADLWGVSRTRVFQIEKRAMRKLLERLWNDREIRANYPHLFADQAAR